MEARVTTCPACGAAVGEDRLTCGDCGTVMAAVTGAVAQPPVRPPPGATHGLFDDDALAPAPQAPPAADVVREPAPKLLAPPGHEAAPIAPPHPTARPELGPNTWYSSRPGAAPAVGGAASAPTAARRVGLLSDLPMQVPSTLGGRIAVAGLGLVAFAFLLPWSPLSSGIGWFDAWGLARPSRLIVFVAAIAVLGTAVAPARFSPLVRTGWLPTLFGVFVAGVFWERVDGIAYVGLGAWLFVVGGILAAVGGLLVLATRGSETPSA